MTIDWERLPVEVLKQFQQMKAKLDVSLVVSVSSQEEVGLRGAQVAAQRIQPKFCHCVRGFSEADDGFQQGRGKGKLRGTTASFGCSF